MSASPSDPPRLRLEKPVLRSGPAFSSPVALLRGPAVVSGASPSHAAAAGTAAQRFRACCDLAGVEGALRGPGAFGARPAAAGGEHLRARWALWTLWALQALQALQAKRHEPGAGWSERPRTGRAQVAATGEAVQQEERPRDGRSHHQGARTVIRVQGPLSGRAVIRKGRYQKDRYQEGPFSPIHLLAILALAGRAVWHARRQPRLRSPQMRCWCRRCARALHGFGRQGEAARAAASPPGRAVAAPAGVHRALLPVDISHPRRLRVARPPRPAAALRFGRRSEPHHRRTQATGRGAFSAGASVVADVAAHLAAEHPIGPSRVHEDDRQQEQRADEKEGLGVGR